MWVIRDRGTGSLEVDAGRAGKFDGRIKFALVRLSGLEYSVGMNGKLGCLNNIKTNACQAGKYLQGS